MSYIASSSDDPREIWQPAIATNDEEGNVSDISIYRARVVVAEMDCCREVTDLAGTRSAVIRSIYWADPVAVGRIQLAMNVKVVAQ